MALTVHDAGGCRLLEGAPGERLMARADDVVTVIESCFEHGSYAVLLYPENLSERFFDLSSGEAGTILQKLRNYHIRLAIVRTPALELSRRFEELLLDENRGPYFRLLDDRAAAETWLCAA
jgi:hypothetical protein